MGKKQKLFCFAYAGGSSAIFQSWKKKQYDGIEVIPMEYSGRGQRFAEKLCESIEEIVEDFESILLPQIIHSDFSFFGHSMGSIVAYEMARKLESKYGLGPVKLFCSGQSAPHRIECDKPTFDLPFDEFLAEIKDMGGTPPEFFEEPSLQEIFVPIMRADFKAVETYGYIENDKRLACDIVVFSGTRDDSLEGEVEDWAVHSKGTTSNYTYEGDHFFIHDHMDSIIKKVVAEISNPRRTPIENS